MATRFPDRVAKGIPEQRSGRQYFYEEELAAAGDTDVVYYPTEATYGKVQVVISSGSGRFFSTMSSREKVEADTADWTEWPRGTRTSTTDYELDPCTAVKGENISGTVLFNFFFQV